MRIFGYGPNDNVFWGVQGQDLFHVALHFLSVVVCFPFNGLDPISAGLAGAVTVELTQAYEGDPTLGDLRDLLFRGLGVALGIGVGLLFSLI